MANSKKASQPIKKTISSKTSAVKKVALAKKPASKTVASKTKVSTNKLTPVAKKSVTSKKVVAKAVVSTKASSIKKVEVKKATVKKVGQKAIAKNATTNKPTATSLIKKPLSKINLPEKSIPVKEVEKKVVAKKVISSEKANKEVIKKVIVPVKVEAKDKKREKIDEKLDPLHVKAAKAIKEMEETMDLSKVRPRIQAGPTPSPKPIVRLKEPQLKLVEPTNTTKVKYSLEFEFRSSPKILFNCLCDSSGLAGWFADEVRTKDRIYTFVWEGGESYAKLVAIKDQHLVRFQWLDDTDGTYFQFEIKEDDITSDIALEITDFANLGDREASIRLWESQVQSLRMLLGSL